MKNSVKKSPGEKMKDLRGKRSRQEVAKAVGVSFSSYVKYERNERVPRDTIKKQIAEYFNVTVGFIFFN